MKIRHIPCVGYIGYTKHTMKALITKLIKDFRRQPLCNYYGNLCDIECV